MPPRTVLVRTLLALVATAAAFAPAPTIAREAACGTEATDAEMVAAARAALDAACDCVTAASPRQYRRCARAAVKLERAAGRLRRPCARAVLRCALRSTCGRDEAVACCRTKASGATRCSIARRAEKCRPPRGGTACAGTAPSCCDACVDGGCAPPPTTTSSTTSSTTSTSAPPTSTTTTSTSTSSTTTVATPCGDTYPTCDGSCPPGEQCWPEALFPPAACACAPVGVVPCSSAEFPTCGGACPDDGVCGPIAVYTSEFGTMLTCTCLDPASDCSGAFSGSTCPGICEPGSICVAEPEPAGMGGCVGCLPEGIVGLDP